MAKYSKKLVAVIVELIENDMSITDICTAVGITRKTFYEWKGTKPEFEKAIEEANDRAYDELIALARRTLRDRIEGYTVEETTFTYEPASFDENEMILKKKVVKRKRKEASIASLNALIDRTQSKSRVGKKSKEGDVVCQSKKKGLVIPTNSKEAFVLAEFFKKIECRDQSKASEKNII